MQETYTKIQAIETLQCGILWALDMRYNLKPDNRKPYENLLRHLSDMDHQQEWSVVIERYKRKRTLEQNDHLHWLIRLFCTSYHGKATAAIMQHTKRELAESCGFFDEYRGKDGVVYTFPKRTSNMSVKELSDMIVAAMMLCDELEIKIPDSQYMKDNFGHG